jgi:thioredoxin reductase
MLYDVIIMGGGPAGLTAGLYSSKARCRLTKQAEIVSPSNCIGSPNLFY